MKYYTVKEAADILRLTPATVYKLTAAGELPCLRHGRGRILYTIDMLNAYIMDDASRLSSEFKGMSDSYKEQFAEK